MTRAFVALLAVLLVASSSWAIDTINFKNAKTQPVRGEVESITATVVTLGGREIGVNEIRDISFELDPPELKAARLSVRGGQLEDALSKLNELKVAELPSDPVRDDVEYYKAYCLAKLALGGSGDKTAARTLVTLFIQNRKTSYHFFDAAELYGDLSVSMGEYDKAVAAYGNVAKAPWPDYQLRATVLEGRALQAQNKPAEALAKFEIVLKSTQAGPLVDDQKTLATIGKAACLGESGQPAEGIALIEGLIEKSDPRDAALFGRAYNALGACYRSDKNNKEAVKSAILAYLHVDLLFAQDPEAHAEALYYLGQLWDQAQFPERGQKCRNLLQQRYPGSRWLSQR